MDAIGIPKFTIPAAHALPAISVPSAPAPHQVSVPALSNDNGAPATIDLQAAHEKRLEALQQQARSLSATHGTFTMFQFDGQLITRFTNITDGIAKITYIPQMDLFKMAGTETGGSASVLNMSA